MDRGALATFLLSLGTISCLASLGFYISDEAVLGVGAFDLYGGDVADAFPLDYFRSAKGGWTTSGVTIIGDTAYTTETRALAALAFPFYLALLAIDAVAPAAILLVAFAAGGLAAGSAILAPRSWRWPIAIAGGAAFLANALAAPQIADVWLAPLAMQLASIAISAAAVTAIYLFVARRTGAHDARVAAGLLLFGTTFAFWAFGQKYHALQLALISFVLLFRFTSASARWHAAAWACAALSVWVHIKTGALVVGALGVVELVALRRARLAPAASARRAGVLALGFALGLAPLVVESLVLYDAPLVVGSVAGVTPSEPAASTPSSGAPPVASGEPVISSPSAWRVILLALQRHTVLEDPSFLPTALWSSWVAPGLLTDRVTIQFGLLMLAPALAAAPLGILATRRRLDGADAFLAIHLAALLLVYGVYAARATNGGYESRYLYVAYPALVVWAAAWWAPRLRASPARSFARCALLAGAIAAAIVALLAARPLPYSTQFLLLRTLGLLALSLVVLACALALLERRGLAPRWPKGSVDAAVFAFALVPALLFLLQFTIHHPPRTAFAAADGATVDLLLPWTKAINLWMRARLGI